VRTRRNSFSSDRSAIDHEKKELRAFWLRTTEALARLAVFGLFAGLHRGMDSLIGEATPKNWTSVATFISAVLSLVFLVLYLTLAWDTLSVFLPWMRKQPRRSINDEASDQSFSLNR